MLFHKGHKIEVFRKSYDEAWEDYMDDFIGLHGYVTDPDASINDPDSLIEVSLQGKGTFRLPQDCLRVIDSGKAQGRSARATQQVKELISSATHPVHVIDPEKSVADALRLMTDHSLSALIVKSQDTYAGIFTERDVLRCHASFPDAPVKEIRIKDVMTSRLIVAEPDDEIKDAMGMMIKARIRHLPVISMGNIVGLLALEDLVKHHVGALTQELHYLQDYITDLHAAGQD
ncbi:MAG: CBS domain-containing protein [Pseudomonadota bacterium]